MDELQIRCAKNENKTTTVTYDIINNIDNVYMFIYSGESKAIYLIH